MILKDRFLTQSPPDTCCKLRKQAFGPNQSFEKLLQLAQMVYCGREYKEENKRQKRIRQKTEAPTMAVRSALKQPEEKCPEEPSWDGLVITVERRGISSGIALRHLSHTWLQVCKGPYWRRDFPPRCRPQGSDSQDNLDWRCPEAPYKFQSSGISPQV